MKKLNRELILNDLISSKGHQVAYALKNEEFLAIDKALILYIYSTEKSKVGYVLNKVIYKADLYESPQVIKEVKLTKTTYYFQDEFDVEFLDSNQAGAFENYLKNQRVQVVTSKEKKNRASENNLSNKQEGKNESFFSKKMIHSNWINIWILITSLIAIATPGVAIFTVALVVYAMKTTQSVKKELVPEISEYKQFKNESVKLRKELKLLNEDISVAEDRLKTLERDYELRTGELSSLEESLNKKYSDLDTEDIEINNYEEITSSEIKDRISLISLREKELVKEGGVVIHENDFKKAFINNQVKQILRTFNVECDFYFGNVTANNIDTYRDKIVRAYETTNRLYKKDGVELSKAYLELKLKKLNYIYEFEVKKEQEKELQKAAREQMLEEQRVQQEIERQRKEIAKEEKHFNNEVNKLMKYISKTNSEVEKELYLTKIKELEAKLEELDKDKKDVENRAANTRAGYVYIISNIGSFGEEIYKIGVTRRLQPMDRVNELSSASVPFPFDVHAMIFSDDAPKLENTLHQHFRSQELNKVNPRKEFFNVSLDKIEEVVKTNHNDTVIFTRLPKATEYRETQKLVNKTREDAVV